MWIGDVFGRERGEQIELEDVADFFHRTSEMDVLERADSHVVMGAKGSGKSTALRALTFKAWRRRAPEFQPPFVGIYLPMGYDHVNLFRLAHDEQQGTALFEHFFVSSLMHEMCVQLSGIQQLSEILPRLLEHVVEPIRLTGAATLGSLAAMFQDDRSKTMKAMRVDPTTPLARIALDCPPLAVDHIAELAEQYKTAITFADTALPSKLGLCLDSFDYYGLLGAVIAPLLQSDSGLPLVVKVAARTLNVRNIFESGSSRRLEMGRDYDLVSFDRSADDPEHFTLVRQAICRRVRLLGPAEAKNLSDSEILDLLFYSSADDGSSDLAALSSFCRLSSGNVLAVILLLDEAARLQREATPARQAPLAPLERIFRQKAVENISASFWSFEIGQRVPSQTLEATVFCDVALKMSAKAKDVGMLSPHFYLETVAPQKHLLTDLLASRVLTARESDTNRRAQAGLELPRRVEFELNRTLLPAKGHVPIAGPDINLDRKAFGTAFRKEVENQKPHLSPHASHQQRELFATEFRVFLSIPYDKTKRARSKVLRQAISRIYREQTRQEGGETKSFVDVHSIPKQGSFTREIPTYIRSETYVVADVSDVVLDSRLASGVFYEIGVAVRLRKPLALFFNARDPEGGVIQFDPERMPAILRGQTVLRCGVEVGSFYDQYKRVHEKLAAYNGFLSTPLDVPVPLRTTGMRRTHAYLSFQPRHRDAERVFTALIREMFPEIHVEQSRTWTVENAGVLCDTIATAEFSIIDCTDGINAQALELGMAAAVDDQRAIVAWNHNVDDRLFPITMFPGHRLAWHDLGEDDLRDAREVIRRTAAGRDLGLRTE